MALIRRFIEACVRADPDDFASYFTEDAQGWNSPWKPVAGRAATRENSAQGRRYDDRVALGKSEILSPTALL